MLHIPSDLPLTASMATDLFYIPVTRHWWGSNRVDPVHLFLSLSSETVFEFRPLPIALSAVAGNCFWVQATADCLICSGWKLFLSSGHCRLPYLQWLETVFEFRPLPIALSAVAENCFWVQATADCLICSGWKLFLSSGHCQLPYRQWPELKNSFWTQTQKQVNKNHRTRDLSRLMQKLYWLSYAGSTVELQVE